jgi:hypothetical protein
VMAGVGFAAAIMTGTSHELKTRLGRWRISSPACAR